MLAEEMELLRETQADADYLEAHYGRLQEEYPGECVAIRGEKVVAHHASLDVVLDELRRKGFDLTKVVLDRILPKDVALVV